MSRPPAGSFYAPDELEVLSEKPDDLGRSRLVHASLHELGSELAAAVAAIRHDDWSAALEAVRMIQGRAIIARRALEGLLGSYPSAADLPPLVRAVQAVGRVISDREVEALAPDELRARMHAVLRALDRELRAFLEPPEEASGATARAHRPRQEESAGHERP